MVVVPHLPVRVADSTAVGTRHRSERTSGIALLTWLMVHWSFYLAAVVVSATQLSIDATEFITPKSAGWTFWSSQHPSAEVASRQELQYQELTLPHVLDATADAQSPTGLTGGFLRLDPFKELPSHFHPDPYGEVYQFIRGNGEVVLGQFTPLERWQAIEPGLHVNIPARTLHGVRAGSEGCEFAWMFAAQRWSDIPYIYADPHMPSSHIPEGYIFPVPIGATSLESLRRNASGESGRDSEL